MTHEYAMNVFKKNIVNFLITKTKETQRNFKTQPHNSYVWMLGKVHKLSQNEVLLSRIALGAILVGLEILIENN